MNLVKKTLKIGKIDKNTCVCKKKLTFGRKKNNKSHMKREKKEPLAMCWNPVDAKCLRERSEGSVPDVSGIYKWWASRKCLKTILDALQLNMKDVENSIEKKENIGLYCIYVGQADSLEVRLKGNHVNGRGKSTFRKSVEAVVKKIYGNQDVEKNTNSFIDKLKIEYRLVPKEKLDDTEIKEIGDKYLRLFNQQHNGGNELRKTYGITKKLKELRNEL